MRISRSSSIFVVAGDTRNTDYLSLPAVLGEDKERVSRPSQVVQSIKLL
jgi:hypothetical protein